MLLSFVLFSPLGLKWRASSLDTAIGVFGIIHRLGACECTTSSGLGSREGLRARRNSRGGDRRLRCLGETILHGRGLSLVRRSANLNDVTMSGSWRRGELWIGLDAFESVSGTRGARGDRRKNGRCRFDPRGWSARRERTVFYRTRGRHLTLDVVELLLVVVRVEGARWATTSDLGVAGLLLEGIRRRRIIDRRVRERGGGAATRAKGSVGRRGREDDCTWLVGRLSGVAKVVLWVLIHAGVVGDRRGVERAVDHFGITAVGWQVTGGRNGCVVDHRRVAKPGLAVEGSGVDVRIFVTSALATDDPDGEDGDDGNTSKSGGGITSDGADAGAIVRSGRGRRKASGRASSGLGGTSDGELLRGRVSVD